MLTRIWSYFKSDDKSKRKLIKEKNAQHNELSEFLIQNTETPLENLNQNHGLNNPTEDPFYCEAEYRDSFSSSHPKLVAILERYKDKNLDEFTAKEVKAVMNKVYPILEKIYLKESKEKCLTAWMAIFYTLTAEHTKFNDLFKDLWNQTWYGKCNRSESKREVYDFVFWGARSNYLNRVLLENKPLRCYRDMAKLLREMRRKRNLNK